VGTEINLKCIDLTFCVMSRNDPDLREPGLGKEVCFVKLCKRKYIKS